MYVIGRVSQVTPPAGDTGSPTGLSTTEYKDNTGDVTKDIWVQISTDAKSKAKKQYYDARGNVIKLIEVVADEDDYETIFEYDNLDRLITTTDHFSNEITTEYDSLGRKVSSDDPDMGEWTYKYDDAGRLIEQVDARGNKVELYYNDEIGRLTEKKVYDDTPQLVDTITYTCDSGDENHTVYKGLLYMVEDGQGWTKTGYDTRCRAIKTTRYLSENSESYTIQTNYDYADRVQQVTYPGNVASLYYSYDSAGHLTGVESLFGTGQNETFYTAQGFDELRQSKGVDYGNEVKTRYEFYDNSKRNKRIHTYYGDPMTGTQLQDLEYTYDKVSNLTSITDSAYTGSASSGLSNIQYDDLHRLTSLNSDVQGQMTYSYNAIGNLISNGESSGGDYVYGGSRPHAVTNACGKSYQYDECGNMKVRGNQQLTYDEQNRLISVTKTGQPTVTFGYTEDGSRLWKKKGSIITQIRIGDIYEEKDGKILCHVIANGQLIATFEPQGLIAGIIQNNYFFAKGHKICTTAYAGLFRGGRTPLTLMSLAILSGLCSGLWYTRQRLWTKYGLTRAGRTAVFYARNPWRQMAASVLITAFILGGIPQQAFAGEPTYDPVFYYYHADHLGSSSIMTDRDGNLVQHYGYSPYGKEQYINNSEAFEVSNRFTGQILDQIFDEDIGLYYYGARYYDTELARFIQPDTIIPGRITDNSQVLNRYSYVMNNPLKYIDPSGHNIIGMIFGFICGIFGGFGGAIGGFVGGFIGGIGGMAAGAIGSIGSIAGAAAVNIGSLANFAVGVGAGVASAVGQIGSAAASGLWNAGSFTINAMASTISGAGKIINAAASAIYGHAQNASDYIIQACAFGEPEKGEVVHEIIDSAIMPWMLPAENVETWEAYKQTSWLNYLIGLTPDPSLPLQLVWNFLVGKVTTALGDSMINLATKFSGKEYWAAHLKVQKYVYKRTLFNWKLHWVAQGKPYLHKITSGYRYEPMFGAYRGVKNAASAIDRAMWYNPMFRERWGESRWRQ